MNREELNSECLSILINNSYNEKGRVNLAYVLYEGVIDKLIDLIQRNTESKGEWVSVEGYTSEVLDHWAYHKDHKPRLCHLDVFGNGMWIDSITNQGLFPKPTHIMPINVPKPPKQGSNHE